MREAALLLITVAVFGYPIVVTDIVPKAVIASIDGGDSLRVDPVEVTPLPTPVLVID